MPTATNDNGALAGRARLRATGEALLWIVFGAVLWALTNHFDEATSAYRLGTASWPRAVLVLLFVCAGLQWLAALRSPEPTAPAAAKDQPDGGSLSLLAIFVLPLAYAWLLPLAGFFATTPVFLALLLWLLGERVWWRLGLAAILIWAIVVLIFSALLYVPLPTGNWPGFYDFSNFVLALIR